MSIAGISSDKLMYRLIGQLLDQVRQNTEVVTQAAAATATANQQNSEIVVEASSESHIDVRA